MSRRIPWIPAGCVVAIVILAALAPLLPLPDPTHMEVKNRLAAPSTLHLLGQDEFGRDVLARLIWGARASLFVAFSASAIACLLGTALGIVGGYLRGLVEQLALRSTDVLLCFPPLLLGLLVVTLMGPGAATLIPVLALVYWPGFTRIAYAGVLTVRSQAYVEAVQALGAGSWRVMALTVLPNVAGPLLVQFSLAAASAVVLESGLSFLGLGVGLRDAIDPHHAPPRGRRRSIDRVLPGLVADRGSPLQIRGLTLAIGSDPSHRPAVRDASIKVGAGETLAVVGESGSGKSLTGLSVLNLLPEAVRVVSGSVLVDGEDVLRLDEVAARRLRGLKAAMVFQDPMSSLNPVHRVGEQIAEAVRAHDAVGRRTATRRAVELLREVGIPDPERRARAYPHELSGGMRQRVMIAIALANHPRVLIADEPTTALDVTIQAQVLELLAGMKRNSDLALVFISHSLPVVAEIADRVVVMYAGEIVEEGDAAAVFADPLHPYTAALLASAPGADGVPPKGIAGVVPGLNEILSGCQFAPRCARRQPRCEEARPPLIDVAGGRKARCIRWADA